MSTSQIQEIEDWQKRTNSLVFIDGSFQFMQWDGTRRERTSALPQESTFRLISLSKALAIPSFRFAYLLHPSRFHDDLLFLYESIVGGATILDLAFAERGLKILSGTPGNLALTNFLQNTYVSLIENDIIRTKIVPDCGYFVFAFPGIPLPSQAGMGQDYFELKGYPGYVRINLMAANKLCLRR